MLKILSKWRNSNPQGHNDARFQNEAATSYSATPRKIKIEGREGFEPAERRSEMVYSHRPLTRLGYLPKNKVVSSTRIELVPPW